MIPQTKTSRRTAPDDDWQPDGACTCAAFSIRGRTLHNYGQPGCRHEPQAVPADQVSSC
ncbi:MAG: hypothetical protein QOF58_7984 [Pseudonocardiales bacterium]|jgi:hypothetical protein|nr:hypothetical protein [Pseudonocardiales bacterium]